MAERERFVLDELPSWGGLMSASPLCVGSSVVIVMGLGLVPGMAEAKGEMLGLRAGLAKTSGLADGLGETIAAGVGEAVTGVGDCARAKPASCVSRRAHPRLMSRQFGSFVMQMEIVALGIGGCLNRFSTYRRRKPPPKWRPPPPKLREPKLPRLPLR